MERSHVTRWGRAPLLFSLHGLSGEWSRRALQFVLFFFHFFSLSVLSGTSRHSTSKTDCQLSLAAPEKEGNIIISACTTIEQLLLFILQRKHKSTEHLMLGIIWMMMTIFYSYNEQLSTDSWLVCDCVDYAFALLCIWVFFACMHMLVWPLYKHPHNYNQLVSCLK